MHLPQFDAIGYHGQPLLDWLQSAIFPAEARWARVDYAATMSQRAIAELLRAGTTGFAAYTTVHHPATLAALEAARRYDIQAWIGQSLMDCNAPVALCGSTSQLIDEVQQTIEQYPSGSRVSAAITPRFALACSDQLLEQCGRLTLETGALMQTHLAENLAECAAVVQRFGKSYVEVYDSFGLLTPRSILGHGIHLCQLDLRRLAQSQSIVAHCPTANSFLRSGTMRRAEMRDQGVRIAVGSDIGAGYEHSMVRVARAMIEAAASVSDRFPEAAEAFHCITAGNADLLGWPEVGRLREGAFADLVLVEPTVPWLGGDVQPLSRLLFGWDDRWIRSVWLRGVRAV